MILLDTNIIVDCWRNPAEEARLRAIRQAPCICGVVLAELLYGASNEREAVGMQEALSAFQLLETYPDIWRCLGMNLAALRRAGLVIPLPDVLLATMAIEHNVQLWSRDKHFVRMQQVLPSLQLYKPETES